MSHLCVIDLLCNFPCVGQTSEGTLNFTSSEPSQHPIPTQVDNVYEPFERESTFLDIEERVDDDDDDDDDEISIST